MTRTTAPTLPEEELSEKKTLLAGGAGFGPCVCGEDEDVAGDAEAPPQRVPAGC